MQSMKSGNLKNKYTFVVIGRSGSGKGTQAKFLVRKLERAGVAHLETGRFLREVLQKYDNPTTQKARILMGNGKLFPSWFPVYTWLQEIFEHGIADRHWVFDGAPRALWEAKLIDSVVEWHERPLPIAIYVDITPKEATRRLLKRGRADDHKQSIQNRMNFFAKDVLPVIRYYRGKKRLLVINGDKPVERVWRGIDRALAKRLGRAWSATRKKWPRGG